MAIQQLKRKEPTSASVAPYTCGARKTKSKMSWGTSSPEAGSSVGLCKHSHSLAIAYQSRWYDKKGVPYVIEIDGDLIVKRTETDREVVAKLRETPDRNGFTVNWLIPIADNLEFIENTERWLGILKDKKPKKEGNNPFVSQDHGNVQAIRNTLIQASPVFSDVSCLRKTVKIGKDGAIELSTGNHKSKKELFHKLRNRPTKVQSEAKKARQNAIKMY